MRTSASLHKAGLFAESENVGRCAPLFVPADAITLDVGQTYAEMDRNCRSAAYFLLLCSLRSINVVYRHSKFSLTSISTTMTATQCHYSDRCTRLLSMRRRRSEPSELYVALPRLHATHAI